MDPPPPQTRSWSIYGRLEITDRYEILNRIGSGAYSDVYRARRKSDHLMVALKEIHDYQSSFREIEALQTLRHSPNVVDLIEYFWSEEEDAVLVLEFLLTDLEAVIKDGKRSGGIGVGQVKQWMLQMLRGLDDCHRILVVHRDLKPSNLLVSESGVLKLADFGQARILQESTFISLDCPPEQGSSENETWISQERPIAPSLTTSFQVVVEDQNAQELKPLYDEVYLREVDSLKAKYPVMDDNTDQETSIQDGDVSFLATCSTADMEDDPGTYSYKAAEVAGEEDESSGSFTSCVGTRWFRAPELLYGCTSYGVDVDLWSLGCIFAELLSLEPLFPGTSDLDQLSKIITVLGDMTEESWPGFSKLPDYNKISFNKIENPFGLESCLLNRCPAEVNIVKKLLCYDPEKRATAMELLRESYFAEEPLPVPLNELRIPSREGHDESSEEEWGNNRDIESASDLE